MEEVPKPKTPPPERQIYSPEQFQNMLTISENFYPDLVPFLILGGMCFLRTAELVRSYAGEQILQWSDIHWDENLIHVRPSVAKGTRRESDERFIPLSKPAKHWLSTPPIAALRQAGGDAVPVSASKLGELWREMMESARVESIDNGLRHSCLSYALAADPTYGVALVSQWAGNSEATIRKHYRRLVKQSEGLAWFAVEPF